MPRFLKRYPNAATAREAVRRSRKLRAQGVPTPDVMQTGDPLVLAFNHVSGDTGAALIDRDLSLLLDAVARLQGAVLPDLLRYDPMLRIRPRLTGPDRTALRGLLDGPMPSGSGIVHGDLHVGQFIMDDDQQVWIVDLDDLAVGPPEADLGNFSAHLATTEPRMGIASWAMRISDLWRAAGRPLDPIMYQRCLDLSLLRRHLKLREVGRPDFRDQIDAYLRERDSFSIL